MAGLSEEEMIELVAHPGIKIDGPLLREMRQEVASLLKRKTVGFPGAQPVSFSRAHLHELTLQDYYVCEKSDGMRYLLYLTEDEKNEELCYLIDRRNDFWFMPKGKLHFPVINDIEGFHRNTIIDGELVLDKVRGGGLQMKYLVFDCLVLDGNILMNRTLDKRLAYFQERIFSPYHKLLFVDYPEEQKHQHFIVEMKAMQFSYALALMFKEVLPGLAHGNDGLIFTCRMTDYKHGTDPHILKWKPANENSIDFHLMLDFPLITPDAQDIAEGFTKPYRDYDAMPDCGLYIFLGDNRPDEYYGQLYLTPEEWETMKARGQPLDDRIVECFMDDKKRWRFLKFRDDKETANHKSTVESVIDSIKDRITKEDLIEHQQVIRTAWKSRAAASSQQRIGDKRKPEDQGVGRPSPGPGRP